MQSPTPIRLDALLEISQAILDIKTQSDLKKVLQICSHYLQTQGMPVSVFSVHHLPDETQPIFRTCQLRSNHIFRISPDTPRPNLFKLWEQNSPQIENQTQSKTYQSTKSHIHVPFKKGIITAHSNRSHVFSEKTTDILKEMGCLIALGLMKLEDQERVQTQIDALVEQQQNLKNNHAQLERLATIGQLSAGMTHDFNNALMTIMGSVEMLAIANNIAPQTQDELLEILQICKQSAQMVRQILDLSRQSEVEIQSVDLTAVLNESKRFLARILPASIKITINTNETKPYIKADTVQLYQIFANLAIHARDAMPNGGQFTLSLSTLSAQKATQVLPPNLAKGRWAHLSITDTGKGIPIQIQEQFFTLPPQQQGTGLGLAQVYHLIQKYKGHILVHSEINKGTTFDIYLPTTQKAPSVFKETPNKMPEGNGETILVVEDDILVQRIMTRMLARLNYRPVIAPNGYMALEMLHNKKHNFALTLTDQVMPAMSGLELISKIRNTMPNHPVLLITGLIFENLPPTEDIVKLSKPIEISDLAQALHQALAQNLDT